MDLQKIIENLVDAFLSAGDLSLELRKKGLSKKMVRIHLAHHHINLKGKMCHGNGVC